MIDRISWLAKMLTQFMERLFSKRRMTVNKMLDFLHKNAIFFDKPLLTR